MFQFFANVMLMYLRYNFLKNVIKLKKKTIVNLLDFCSESSSADWLWACGQEISHVWNVFVFTEANFSNILALTYHPTSEAPQKLPPETISCFICLFLTNIKSMQKLEDWKLEEGFIVWVPEPMTKWFGSSGSQICFLGTNGAQLKEIESACRCSALLYK